MSSMPVYMMLQPSSIILFLVLVLFTNSSSTAQILPPIFQSAVTDYAPNTNVQCPDLSTTSLIRVFTPENQTLHPQELEYINTRSSTVLPRQWADWLGDGSGMGYNLSTFHGQFPTLGIAIPGGGLRAALFGAGCLNALDARNDSAKAAGTGGLLQVASYITGLSGGSWVTGSLFFNNWPTIPDLVFGNGENLDGWLLDIPFVTPDGINVFSEANQAFFGSILWSVTAKAAKGIDTSITDPWSRMISYHFLNQTSRKNFLTNDTAHGAGQIWSNIPNIPVYQQHLSPFPILVANSRPVGSNLTTALSLESTVYELTPLEFASFDPSLSAGMNLTFVGTHLTNGKPKNGSACVTGFDQAGFIMGTSASLFNQLFDFARNKIAQFSKNDGAGLLYVLSRQLQEVRTRADDVANWPSPFHGLKTQSFQDTNVTWLELLDGDSNHENIPYGPLLVRARGVDVIITVEGSADDPIHNWPNGTGLLFTARRQSIFLQSSHRQFPPIPSSAEEFIATGVNSRPTFFGCDPPSSSDYPLVIYLPNAPPITGEDPVTNTPTFQLSYTLKHTQLFLDQVYANIKSGFTPNSNNADPNWGTCLQCAVFDRARYTAIPPLMRSARCSQCFKQYCFDPQSLSSKSELPNRKLAFVDPDPKGFSKLGLFFSGNKFKLVGALIGLVAFIAVVVFGLLWWKRRRDHSKVYKNVKNLHDEEPLFMKHSRHPRVNGTYYELSVSGS